LAVANIGLAIKNSKLMFYSPSNSRTKLKQTEVDCEFLKRCCENLTEENRRLQKELQELRALKLSPQFYMQMNPPTTLTMCPSCERVSSSSAGNSGSTSASTAAIVLPSMHQSYQHHRPMVPAPWAPISLRPAFLDTPPQRS
jgi:homeobox-leucine zipper protein